MTIPPLRKRLGAEFLGTFWLVLGGCGTAIFGSSFFTPEGLTTPSSQIGVGLLGVALAFGLSVVTMAYAVGHVSGAHFNPAVTIGLWAARRFDNLRDLGAYVVAQVLGGLAAGAVLWGLAKSVRGSGGVTGALAANGYGEHSPGGFSLVAVLLAEILLTAFFVFVILGVTTAHAPTGFAPLAIGLTLTLIHLVSIPISNTSVNPARSTAVAFFNGNGAPGQLWLFWVAPIVGAVIAGWSFEAITGIDRSNLDIGGAVNPGEVMAEPPPQAEEPAAP
jgi:aquaporin Z